MFMCRSVDVIWEGAVRVLLETTGMVRSCSEGPFWVWLVKEAARSWTCDLQDSQFLDDCSGSR